MDQQRPFLYLTLFFLGFLIWSTWQEEHAPKPPAQSPVQIGIAGTDNNQAIPSTADIPNNVSTAGTNSTNQIPVIDVAKDTGIKKIHIKTDVLDLYVNLQGGTIIQADLPTYPISLEQKDKAVRIIDTNKGYAAQSGLIHRTDSKQAPNHYAKFNAQNAEYILAEGQTNLVVPIVWSNQAGITVTKRFIFKRSKFLVHVEQQIDNQSANPWFGNEYLQLTHGESTSNGGFLTGVQTYTGAAFYNEKYEKVSFGDIEDEKLNQQIKGGWLAMLQHYFVSAWVPSKDNENTYYTNYYKDKSSYIIGVKSPEISVNAGNSFVFKNQLYVGPALQSDLEEISKGLDLTVDYGIFAFVSKPIFGVMDFIHKYVNNWGWTIIFLTMLIKLVFFYPSAISYRSMAKMKKMAPKIKALNEKYKNDPQAKQKETFAFYKKEKINPLGGCLPMLIQMPVFMGLYWVLLEAVELRQAPWLLWYQDLSIRDPYFVLPIIMGASMWFQQKLNPPMMQDPMQQKIFTYLPLVFTVMFLFFPAGLVLYWVVNNILGILQQWYITKKVIGDDA